jgi:hypothetical protein
LGGLKEARGGRCAASIEYHIRYLRNPLLFLPWFCFLAFRSSRLQLPKSKINGQNFRVRAKILPKRRQKMIAFLKESVASFYFMVPKIKLI